MEDAVAVVVRIGRPVRAPPDAGGGGQSLPSQALPARGLPGDSGHRPRLHLLLSRSAPDITADLNKFPDFGISFILGEIDRFFCKGKIFYF